MKRKVQVWLQDIAESITIIEKHVHGVSREEFFNNVTAQDAVIRRLEVIGEAAKNVPDEFREKHPDITWKEIAGLRDVLIHGYFGVKMNRIWDVIQDDLPDLKRKVGALLDNVE